MKSTFNGQSGKLAENMSLLKDQNWLNVDHADGGVSKYIRVSELKGDLVDVSQALNNLGVSFTIKNSSIDDAPEGTKVIAIAGSEAIKIARIQDDAFEVEPSSKARLVGSNEQKLLARMIPGQKG